MSIDLSFRPAGYFRPVRLERFLLSKVKNAEMRASLRALFDQGRHRDAAELLGPAGLSARDQKSLERMHPGFMGGNYLPDTEAGEVEVARIRIQSTTQDVTSVYARAAGAGIRYRVVDEYEGDTLSGPATGKTKLPMALGEFADFFLGAWPLIDVCRMNYEDDVDGALGFFVAESDFYPELDALCRERVVEAYGGG